MRQFMQESGAILIRRDEQISRRYRHVSGDRFAPHLMTQATGCRIRAFCRRRSVSLNALDDARNTLGA